MSERIETKDSNVQNLFDKTYHDCSELVDKLTQRGVFHPAQAEKIAEETSRVLDLLYWRIRIINHALAMVERNENLSHGLADYFAFASSNIFIFDKIIDPYRADPALHPSNFVPGIDIERARNLNEIDWLSSPRRDNIDYTNATQNIAIKSDKLSDSNELYTSRKIVADLAEKFGVSVAELAEIASDKDSNRWLELREAARPSRPITLTWPLSFYERVEQYVQTEPRKPGERKLTVTGLVSSILKRVPSEQELMVLPIGDQSTAGRPRKDEHPKEENRDVAPQVPLDVIELLDRVAALRSEQGLKKTNIIKALVEKKISERDLSPPNPQPNQ